MRTFATINPDGYYLLSTGGVSHFNQSEMTCRCGCGADMMDQRQIDTLEAIRVLVGEPIHVNSGVRCWKYHQHVYALAGKAVVPDSQHIPRDRAGTKVLTSGTVLGASRATDITVAGRTPRALRAVIEIHAHELGIVGLGAYPGFTHVDTRDGPPARW